MNHTGFYRRPCNESVRVIGMSDRIALLFSGLLLSLMLLAAAIPVARADHDYPYIAEAADRLAYASEHLHDALDDYGHDDELEAAADRLDEAASDLRRAAKKGRSPHKLYEEFGEVERRYFQINDYFAYRGDRGHGGYFWRDFDAIRFAFSDLQHQMTRLDQAAPAY